MLRLDYVGTRRNVINQKERKIQIGRNEENFATERYQAGDVLSAKKITYKVSRDMKTNRVSQRGEREVELTQRNDIYAQRKRKRKGRNRKERIEGE